VPTFRDSGESYTLESTAQGVLIQAGNETGLFYGATTLAQLATGGSNGVLPAVQIQDAPRFSWRGFMLDSARHFQSLDEIKRVLDAMAAHKLNTFHWHLTDDQGWRMEIKRYPKLTDVGSCRLPAGDGGIDPVSGQEHPYCGFYTQDQIASDRLCGQAAYPGDPGNRCARPCDRGDCRVSGTGLIDTPLKPISEWGVFPTCSTPKTAPSPSSRTCWKK
jgi:hexosaminidase